MGTLNLGTLGTLRLSCSEGGDPSRILSQPKRFALLVYLALAEPRGYHRRDSLLTLFWPELDADHARNALSQALSFLRRELPEGLIRSRGMEEVGLDHDRVYTGVNSLEKAVADRRWADALDLYKGDFLKGFHLSGAQDFDAWVELERERLRELAAGAAWSLAGEQIERGALVEAERTAQRALNLVWTDETPVREFMWALAGAGDRAAALNLYGKFCAKLKEELDLDPSQSTAEVADAIKNGDLPFGTTGLAASPVGGVGDGAELSEEERAGAERAGAERAGPRTTIEEDSATDLQPSPVDDPSGLLSRPGPPAHGNRRWVRWGLIGGFGIALLATAILVPWDQPADPAPVPVQRRLTFRGDVGLAALSPDGTMLAYVAGTEPSQLFVKDLTGDTELVVADSIGLAYDLRWAPTGDRLAFAGDYRGTTGTFIFPRFGGEARPLGLAAQIAWGPEGQSIALCPPDHFKPVAIHNLRSGRVDSIPFPGSDQFAVGIDWSPRGDRLAVATQSGSREFHLWVLDLETGSHSMVFSSGRAFNSPRWAPGEEAIYLSTLSSAGTMDLLRLDAKPGTAPLRDQDQRGTDGDGPLRWVTNYGPIVGRPATLAPHSFLSFAADRRSLAYTSVHEHSNLSVLRPAEAGPTEHVVLTRGTAANTGPTLSPDGTSLAFLRENPQGFDLMVVPTTGGTPVRLNVPAPLAGRPDWGPDSRSLAIPVLIDGVARLAVVSTAGEESKIFPETRPNLSSRPSWAPGSLIAYHISGNRNFRLLDPDAGGRGRLLVSNDSVGWMFDARFSPDGRRVAVYWNRSSPGPGLWVIDLEDGSQTWSAPGHLLEHPIDWSMDGKRIYTVSREGTIRSYPLTGGEGTVVPQPPGMGGARCEPHERPYGLYWVCTKTEVLSEVWMIEDFDPGGT